jgi:hypothetical protein
MFPAFPQGATIPSILIAYAQAGCLSSVRQKLSGLHGKRPRCAMDYRGDPEVLGKYVFGGVPAAQDLQLHHTFAPIHLSCAVGASITGASLRSLPAAHPDSYLPAFTLRQCPQCVEEDTAKFGCGHWRREHQLRFVRICTTHMTALHDRCAGPNCGAEFSIKHNTLPGQACTSCGSTKTASTPIKPISEGYLAYCKLFTDALVRRIPELDLDNRQDLLRGSMLTPGGRSNPLNKQFMNWLGHQFSYSHSLCHQAEYYVCNPDPVSASRFRASALLLIAAFKRAVCGPPADSEMYRWSDVISPPSNPSEILC